MRLAAAADRWSTRQSRGHGRTDVLVGVLVRARQLPGRPIPDALMVAASLAADALPLATFDRDRRRYCVAIREP